MRYTLLTLLITTGILLSLVGQCTLSLLGVGGCTAPAAGHSITLIQSQLPPSAWDEVSSSGSFGTSNNLTFGSATIAGHLLIVVARLDNTTSTSTPTMTGETFTPLTKRTSTNASEQVQIFYTCNATGGQILINMTMSGSPSSEFNTATAYEFAGNANSTITACFDAQTGGQVVSNTAHSQTLTIGGSIGGLLFHAAHTNNYETWTTNGAGSTGTYTLGKLAGHQTTLGVNPTQGADQWQFFTSSGSKTSVLTSSGATNTANAVASFLPQ